MTRPEYGGNCILVINKTTYNTIGVTQLAGSKLISRRAPLVCVWVYYMAWCASACRRRSRSKRVNAIGAWFRRYDFISYSFFFFLNIFHLLLLFIKNGLNYNSYLVWYKGWLSCVQLYDLNVICGDILGN